MRNWSQNRVVMSALLLLSIFAVGKGEALAGDESTTEGVDIAVGSEVEDANMASTVRDQLNSATTLSVSVESMLNRARTDNDTVKILCLDDKLTQIRALLKGIEGRAQSLESAISAKDTTSARHQFVILQVSFNKINGLRVQADACVGNSDIVSGVSETEVTGASEDITAEEATTPEQEIFTPEPVVRPTIASGFR